MLKNLITKTRVKVLFIVLSSFLLVKIASPQIFLADSPKINPLFVAKIKNTPFELARLPSKMIASIINLNPFANKDEVISNVKLVTPPPNIIFKSVAKGVSAAEDPKTGKKYIKIEAGTKYRIAGTVTVNGKQYPKIEFVK